MCAARLSIALDEGGLALPQAGPIAVFRPRAGDDLSALPAERVEVIQGFRPDHDAFARAGYATAVAPQGRYSAALIFLPRNRDQARGLIAQAAGLTDGPVVVDGQKTDGIDGLLRDCRKRAAVSGPVVKAHGKLFWFDAAGADMADWALAPGRTPEGFVTQPGVFSADGVDPGSALLGQALPERMAGRIADLGAGWGYLSAQIMRREGVSEVHLIEAEHAALDCARENVRDARARFHWADATRFDPPAPFDIVVSNPPFHSGRDGAPALGAAFIAAAARMLAPRGAFWLVANRHLPYEAPLQAAFAGIEAIGGDPRYKIIRATRPRKETRG